jgi:hypothetical protein
MRTDSKKLHPHHAFILYTSCTEIIAKGSYFQYYLKVNAELHAPVALTPWKGLLYRLGTHEVWTKGIFPARNQNLVVQSIAATLQSPQTYQMLITFPL